MLTIGLDFETFYSQDYSLRAMTPVEYIQDPRFECFGASVIIGGVSAFVEAADLGDYLRGLGKIAIVSHNALFDMCLLAWRFDIVPELMIDTLGMARAWLGGELKHFSLDALAKHLGLGQKTGAIAQAKGMRWKDIKANRAYYQTYIDYAINDVELCFQAYLKMLRQGFPMKELFIQDMVLRCAVEPKFQSNKLVLYQHLVDVKAAKENLMAKVGITDRGELLSNEKFAECLRQLGVDPPMKKSPATGKDTYAFAKNDPEFIELDEEGSAEVQALVSARLGVKSTIEETRTQRFINVANCQWPDKLSWFPMPLANGAAHTHRLGGTWKLNVQNMGRGSKLRDSLEAPAGFEVVAGDSAQIEARFVAEFCGQRDLVNAFDRGDDAYSNFATDVFGFKVNKKEHPVERFVGKQCILGLGFGLGGVKFRKNIKALSKNQLGQVIDLNDIESDRIVKLYRARFPMIPRMWRRLQNIIPEMCSRDCNMQVGPVTFLYQKVRLPSGLYLYYNNLRFENGEWLFEHNGMTKRLYGGKLLENIIQALARTVTMYAALRIQRTLRKLDRGNAGFEWRGLAHQCHDELVYVVPEYLRQWMQDLLMEEMCIRPDWAPMLPLAAECNYGRSYGDAK